MTIQYYLKKNTISDFAPNARLLYVCYADKLQTSLPTVLHMHRDRLELVYIIEGSGLHKIGDSLYHTQANDLLIFNSNVLHDECANSNTGMSIYTCAVTDLNLNGLETNELIGKQYEPVLHCGKIGESIKNIFAVMIEQISNNYYGANNICQYLLNSLLFIIAKQIPHARKEFLKEEDKIVLRIKQYLDTHFLEALTLDEISSNLKMSSSYLSHKFKDFTGLAPAQYIIRRRIGAAQKMLIGTDRSITDIAAEVGYDNNSYFNTLFKNTVGKTPLDYRKFYVGKEQYNKLDQLSKFDEL